MKQERYLRFAKTFFTGFSLRRFTLSATISASIGLVLLIAFVALAGTSANIQSGMRIYGVLLLAELAIHLGIGVAVLLREEYDLAYGILAGFLINALFSVDAIIAVLFILGPFIKYL